jgi:translocation and assembly module TamB
MELRAVSQTFNLAEISPIVGLPYRGRGPLTATLEGPYNDLVISGTTEFKGFGIDNFQLGQTQATIIFADNALQLPRIDIQRHPGTIEGTARLEFNDVPTFDGAFEIKRVLAAPLLNSIQAIPEHAHRFEGSLDGHITISGELAQPKVRAQIKSDTLFIDEANFGETLVNINMRPEDPWLTIQSRHQPEDGSLEVHMALNNNSPTQFDFKAEQIEMELITPFLGEIEASGSVSGQGAFNGELSALNGEAALQIKQFSVYGFNLGQTDLEFRAQKGQSKVSGSCVAGAASVSANITLGEKMPYTATMQLNEVNISQIHTLPENVDLWLTGSLFSQGDLLNSEAIIADSVFDQARLVWNDIEFNQVRSIRMNYADEVLEFSDAAFAIPELTIRLAGRMPLNQDLSLRLNLDGDLSMVPRLWSEIEAGQGSINASVLMEGTFEAPIYAGHAAIKSGSMRLASIQQEVEDIQARLDISGRTIQISKASARIGSGTVRLGGGVILIQDAPSQTNLQATFSSVRLRPSEDLDLTASGTLNLIGHVGSLELLGDVELLNLHYTSNIELDDMLRKKAKPLPLPGLNPGEAWNLRVNVRGENNLLFTNNFVESELSANLRITGTTQHMGLVGTVTPIWGRATYAGNTYKVERGLIDFVEEYSISPRFEVRASTESSTEACNMQLSVNITGDDTGYTVQAEGQDDSGAPVTSQQALVCAQFGLRLDGDTNSQSNNSSSNGSIMTEENATGVLSGAVDAIWKVTGMDERVRRILPVVDQFTLTSGYSKTSKKTEPRILVTKDLGKNWELKYNGPLYEKDEQHIIALQYRLSSRITLESTWVSFSEAIPSLGDMGLDLRLDWQFE